MPRLCSHIGKSDDLATLNSFSLYSFSPYGMTAAPIEWKTATTVEIEVRKEKGWDLPGGFAAAS